MLFNVSKVFATLAAIAVVTASPAKHDKTTACSFVLHPEGPFDSSELLGEFNYAIGRTLAMTVPGQIVIGGNSTWVDNGDNSFDVQKTVGVIGQASSTTAATVTGWAGTALVGTTTNWFVDSVSCV
ncbi:hypothetical protein BDZ94DRAFT_1265490 [Collybia nuda]|uniref:Uncharacterized protein n=1 Tax=Collybia nuda TaxID=64659 RepID=A0A9P6CFW9_9AGAR|nr:hypothetical protein BDZ94DRAFT_1265490 [Collybia nuda]